MNKCKCVKVPPPEVGGKEFKLNAYYEFDYIPPVKDNPSFYKVFSLEDNVSGSFSIKAFNEHFKKY
ncbi:MAG: hypothetical protein KBB29_04115 [Bacteroidales bacterium]|jgi:hypothetical protein|nr:hypothetical protein [Bacteroidales bacterium]HOA08976.1 hypothetical protein [Tenuifilaceae bacterium]MBP8643323.1 hypothetical protein [Bacteroidales bacterium]NLI88669.1 hypothetical protein [Bacteroidales bacterium]HOC36479.1 hypothetical protein [Tenuifilaceae bacterium]